MFSSNTLIDVATAIYSTYLQRLKDLFYSDTRKICREAGIYLDVELDENSMDLISELAWKKLQLFALDLEAFAKYVIPD